jgi:hypothetical protein
VLVRLVDEVYAMAVLDRMRPEDAGRSLVLRFRPARDSRTSLYREIPVVPNQPVSPGARNMSGGQVCVQPGVRIGAETLYEPWVCLPTSEAGDFGASQREQDPRAESGQ